MSDSSQLHEVLYVGVEKLINQAELLCDGRDNILVSTVSGMARDFKITDDDVERMDAAADAVHSVLDLISARPETRLLIAGKILAEIAMEADANDANDEFNGTATILALIGLAAGGESVLADGGVRDGIRRRNAKVEDDLPIGEEIEAEAAVGETPKGVIGVEGPVDYETADGTPVIIGQGFPSYDVDPSVREGTYFFDSGLDRYTYVKQDIGWVALTNVSIGSSAVEVSSTEVPTIESIPTEHPGASEDALALNKNDES